MSLTLLGIAIGLGAVWLIFALVLLLTPRDKAPGGW